MANAKLQIAIEALNKASGELKTLESDLKAVSNSAQSGSMGFGKLVGAIGLGNLAANAAQAAVGSLGNVLRSSIDEAMEYQRSQAQLTAALNSTGHAAGLTRDQLNEMSGRLSELTAIDDDVIASAQAMLLTFTNIKADAFEPATQAVLDMATAMNSGGIPSAEQLKGTAIMLGKALNDPIQGVNALQRAGVSLTKGQEDLIQKMVKAGNTMGAQKIVLEELRTEFEGSAAAAALTFEGRISKLNNAFGDLKKQIGLAITASILPAADAMTETANSMANSGAVATGLQRTIYGVAQVFKGLWYGIQAILEIIGAKIVKMILLGRVVYTVAGDIVKNFQAIKNAAASVFDAFKDFASGNFSEAWDKIKKSATGFDLSDSKKALDDLERGNRQTSAAVQATWDKAKAAFADAFTGNGLQQQINQMSVAEQEVAKSKERMQKILDALSDGSKSGAEKSKKALESIAEKAADVQSKLADVVRDYTQRSNDRLEDHKKKVAEINTEMAKLQDDFAKSTADKEKRYQEDRLQLFMSHQDKLADAQRDYTALQKDLQKADDPERRSDIEARIAETKKKLDAEKAIVDQYASLKDEADKYRQMTDLERLRLKHEEEKLEDQRAFDEKMVALKQKMQEEEDEHRQQTERLKEETVRRFDEILKEYQKGYDKLVKESKLKHAELKAVESEVQNTLRAIESARASIKGSASGVPANIPKLADGGIVTSPTLALIGERGPEAVIPLDRVQGGSQPVSVSIMEGAMINVTNEADESRLARTVAKELARVLQGNRHGLAAQM